MTPALKPNFLIVGAAKAGTSTLWHWLSRHPQVFMPTNKEPGYFVHGYGINDWTEYLSLFKNGRGKLCLGEATAAYLAAPESAKWIYDTLGKIKIVIVLRNPAFRAFSLYCWMVMEGYESTESFAAALEIEKSRITSQSFKQTCPQYFGDYLYFSSGLYSEQTKRYIDVFGPESVKICLFDDLVSSPGAFQESICDFLGVARWINPNPPKRNASVIPASIAFQYKMRFIQRRTQSILGALGKPISYSCEAAMKINIALGSKQSMTTPIKDSLINQYKSEVIRLSSIINRDLSDWLKP
jgi:Sulfotransferase domain